MNASPDLSLAGLETVLTPLRMRTAGEQIAERLVTAIALGEYVPGQRLPSERELASLLGVSRTTVREALQRLSASGYVEIRRGRNGGAYVKSAWGPGAREMIRRTLLPSWDRFERLFDFRRLIEPLIARTAAERRTEEDLRRINGALEDYRNAGDDREASRAADEALHAAIAQAAHNPYLTAISASIRRDISLGFGAEPYTRAIRSRAIPQHGALVHAIAESRAQRAATIARSHFSLTEVHLRGLFERIRSAGEEPGRSAGEEHR